MQANAMHFLTHRGTAVHLPTPRAVHVHVHRSVHRSGAAAQKRNYDSRHVLERGCAAGTEKPASFSASAIAAPTQSPPPPAPLLVAPTDDVMGSAVIAAEDARALLRRRGGGCCDASMVG